jgi:hypothetical protein
MRPPNSKRARKNLWKMLGPFSVPLSHGDKEPTARVKIDVNPDYDGRTENFGLVSGMAW